MDSREYLNYVLDKLQERIRKLDDAILHGQKEIENMHEYYWENYTEMDQYGYEDFDNQQALLGQVNANKEKLDLRRRFKKMLDSPFFGRVDFIYDGEEEAETFYIGIGNFSKESGRLPLVYDWRAPVSSLFYDYDKGEAYYDAPAGRMEGEVLSKWQYKIRGGKMIYAFESDVKIDDEVLKQELGSHGDVKLKNIIKTIQKEQNAIIRNTQDRILEAAKLPWHCTALLICSIMTGKISSPRMYWYFRPTAYFQTIFPTFCRSLARRISGR